MQNFKRWAVPWTTIWHAELPGLHVNHSTGHEESNLTANTIPTRIHEIVQGRGTLVVVLISYVRRRSGREMIRALTVGLAVTLTREIDLVPE